MISKNWEDEAEAFEKLDHAGRIDWLSKIACALTIAARETYQVQADGLLDPVKARGFNELLHRVVNQLRHQIKGTQGFPSREFVLIVAASTEELDISFSTLEGLMT